MKNTSVLEISQPNGETILIEKGFKFVACPRIVLDENHSNERSDCEWFEKNDIDVKDYCCMHNPSRLKGKCQKFIRQKHNKSTSKKVYTSYNEHTCKEFFKLKERMNGTKFKKFSSHDSSVAPSNHLRGGGAMSEKLDGLTYSMDGEDDVVGIKFLFPDEFAEEDAEEVSFHTMTVFMDVKGMVLLPSPGLCLKVVAKCEEEPRLNFEIPKGNMEIIRVRQHPNHDLECTFDIPKLHDGKKKRVFQIEIQLDIPNDESGVVTKYITKKKEITYLPTKSGIPTPEILFNDGSLQQYFDFLVEEENDQMINIFGFQEIHYCVFMGDFEKVKQILEVDQSQVSITDNFGNTPLFYSYKDNEMRKFLLSNGAVTNHHNVFGETYSDFQKRLGKMQTVEKKQKTEKVVNKGISVKNLKNLLKQSKKNNSSVVNSVKKVIQKEMKKKVQILVLGRKNVGRTSFIKKHFPYMSGNFQKTKDMNTSLFVYYTNSQNTINMLDSKGFLDDYEEYEKNITEYIKKNKMIQAVFYVVNCNVEEIDKKEVEIMKNIKKCIEKSVKFVVVLNFSDKVPAATAVIKKEQIFQSSDCVLKREDMFCVSSTCNCETKEVEVEENKVLEIKEEVDDDDDSEEEKESPICEECGLLKISKKKTYLEESESLEQTFNETLNFFTLVSNLKDSQKKAKKNLVGQITLSITLIIAATTVNGVLGVVPLPFVDWPFMLATESLLLVSLSIIWGVTIGWNVRLLVNFVINVLGGSLALLSVVFIGKGVASALKFIPGIGTIVGGVIDCAISSVMTLLFGIVATLAFSTFSKLLEKSPKKRAKQKLVEETFKKKLKTITPKEIFQIFKNGTNKTLLGDFLTKKGISEIDEDSTRFICPISGRVMVSPYTLIETGVTYEKSEIEKWLKENETCFKTKKKLKSKKLKENVELRKKIEEYFSDSDDDNEDSLFNIGIDDTVL